MTVFWDTKKSDIDQEKNKNFIIARILEKGGLKDVRKLLKQYDSEEIKEDISWQEVKDFFIKKDPELIIKNK